MTKPAWEEQFDKKFPWEREVWEDAFINEKIKDFIKDLLASELQAVLGEEKRQARLNALEEVEKKIEGEMKYETEDSLKNLLNFIKTLK